MVAVIQFASLLQSLFISLRERKDICETNLKNNNQSKHDVLPYISLHETSGVNSKKKEDNKEIKNRRNKIA